MVRHPVSPHKTSADHTKLIKSINAAKDNLIEQSRRWQEIVAGSHRQHISGVNIRFLSFVLHTALISCFLYRNADKEAAADPELCRLGSPRVQSQWSLWDSQIEIPMPISILCARPATCSVLEFCSSLRFALNWVTEPTWLNAFPAPSPPHPTPPQPQPQPHAAALAIRIVVCGLHNAPNA